jgi:hypothetical protein
VSQQQFHYLTAKGGVIDEKASDIGWSINVDVKETSVSGFDLGGLHTLRMSISLPGVYCLGRLPKSKREGKEQLQFSFNQSVRPSFAKTS